MTGAEIHQQSASRADKATNGEIRTHGGDTQRTRYSSAPGGSACARHLRHHEAKLSNFVAVAADEIIGGAEADAAAR